MEINDDTLKGKLTIDTSVFHLPDSPEPYTDIYFTRARRILEAEAINPRVLYQVFIRKGPGTVRGINEAIAILDRYCDLDTNDIRIRALPEGSNYQPGETLMLIEGPVQALMEVETMYLGALSAATSRANGQEGIDLDRLELDVRRVCELIGERPFVYFGARHWHWKEDIDICRAAMAGGAVNASTAIGSKLVEKEPSGTIPHALVLTLAGIHGSESATTKAIEAFDRHIDPGVGRVILVDTFNREIDDALASARALEGRLSGVRLDTCGENQSQGGNPSDGRRYWTGNGVTITGTLAMRQALDRAGFHKVKIVLSSGFNPEKTAVFVEAEKEYGRLFDAIGGSCYSSWMATADIMAVDGKVMHKTGREPRPNPRLQEVRII